MGTRNTGVESHTKGTDTKTDFPKHGPIVQCYRCQDYGHIAVVCTTPFRVNIKKPFAIKIKSTPTPSKCKVEEVESIDSDKESKGDDIEGNSLILPVTTSIIMDSIVVPSEENTPVLPEITHVIT